jgi:hypothetical protein|tara:strand:+ start:124 stop:639 length:516 start_codon:yes stop_codon:yes gene_type:complete
MFCNWIYSWRYHFVIERKNFLSKQECNFFIEFHDLHYGKAPGSRLSNDLKIIEMLPNIIRVVEFRKVLSKLISEARKHDNVYLDYADLVAWHGKGICMEEHTDYPHQYLSSILYLNDDYKGGETVIGDKVIKPETGKIIFFSGTKIPHSVNKLTKGRRYTIPSWYCRYDND